jgi:hypothetical protein
MNQAAGPTGGPRGDVGFVEQQHAKSAPGRIPSDTTAVDPGTNHNQIERTLNAFTNRHQISPLSRGPEQPISSDSYERL